MQYESFILVTQWMLAEHHLQLDSHHSLIFNSFIIIYSLDPHEKGHLGE